MTLLNVDHCLTTPYHPQVIILYNYTTLHLIKEQKECWVDYLECCLFAYNTSKHESSKFTPFEVLFGRQAVLPIEVHYCTNTASLVNNKQLDDDEVEVRMLHQRKVLEVVRINIAAARPDK